MGWWTVEQLQNGDQTLSLNNNYDCLIGDTVVDCMNTALDDAARVAEDETGREPDRKDLLRAVFETLGYLHDEHGVSIRSQTDEGRPFLDVIDEQDASIPGPMIKTLADHLLNVVRAYENNPDLERPPREEEMLACTLHSLRERDTDTRQGPSQHDRLFAHQDMPENGTFGDVSDLFDRILDAVGAVDGVRFIRDSEVGAGHRLELSLRSTLESNAPSYVLQADTDRERIVVLDENDRAIVRADALEANTLTRLMLDLVQYGHEDHGTVESTRVQ